MSNVKEKAATKLDKAIDRARNGGEVANKEPGGEMVSKPSGLESILMATDTDRVAADLASGNYDAAPQLLTLAEGQMIRAQLEGNGPDAEFTNKITGEVTQCQTWILSAGALRVSILSSVQLDKKLPPFVGGEVTIVRGRDVRSGDRIYTDYLVYGPKREDGTPREWSGRPQLPAGPQS